MSRNQGKLTRWKNVLSLIALTAMALGLGWGCQVNETERTENKPAAVNPVERGKYLVANGGCNDCHTPLKMTDKGPAPDMALMFAGHPQDLKMPPPPKLPPGPWQIVMSGTSTAFAGPFGTTFAPNLTPDSATGLGTWTEEKFVKTAQTGMLQDDGRPFMPPMPSLAHYTDEDLRAIYAYLRSVPPIKNVVPEYAPPRGK